MTRTVRNRSVLATVALLATVSAVAQPAFEARTDRRADGLGNPVALVVGDFVNPGDGLLDFAATFDREDALGIFENNGDGTFSLAVPPIVAPPPPGMGGPPESESNIGVNPAGLVAIDLDGDGIRDDIAGVNQDTNRFFAYENGGGTWLPADPDATRGGGLAAAVGRWSSDALPGDDCDDFFSATGNGRVNIAVSRCDGSGEFEIVAGFFDSARVSVQTDIEVGDFVSLGSDSGQVDVLTLDNLNQQIVIWPGDPTLDINLIIDDGLGNGLVLLPVEVGGERVSPVQSLAQDWDMDDQLDLLVLVEEGYVLWYKGNGDPGLGGFDAPTVLDLTGPLSPATRQPSRFTTMDYADLVGVDGASAPDGIPDLVIGDAGQASGTDDGFNWIWIVPGTGPDPAGSGPPTFDLAAQVKYAAPNLGALKPNSLAVADFGTGLPDILALGFDTPLTYTRLVNDGAGGFGAAPSYAVGGTRVRGLASRQLSGQPVGLVAVTRGEQAIAELEGDGTGRLLEPSTLAESSGLGLGSDLKVLDLDGDAVPDALVTHATEHVLYRGLPGGGFASPEILTDGGTRLTGVSRLGNYVDSPAGAPDLAIFDPSLGATTLEIWAGNGDGTFALSQEVGGINNYSTHAAGRFFGDSARDSAVVAGEVSPFASPPALFLVRDDGTGTYDAREMVGFPSPFDMFPSPVQVLVVGDYDGNGYDDVVAVLGGGEGYHFVSDGSTLTVQPSLVAVGAAPRAGVSADVNDDGRPDLIIATRRSVVVFENLGGSFGPPTSYPSNIDNVSVVAVDLTEDGLPELVTASERTNDVTVFRNVSTPVFRLLVGPDPTGTLCRASWPAIDAASYSFVRGNLTSLWDDDTQPLLDVTETAPCGLNASAALFYDDAAPLPAPIGIYPSVAFYLVRCQGLNCPDETFGADSMGMARYSNDPPDPCP